MVRTSILPVVRGGLSGVVAALTLAVAAGQAQQPDSPALAILPHQLPAVPAAIGDAPASAILARPESAGREEAGEPAEGGGERRSEEPLESDRNSFTPSPKTVEPFRLIVEQSYTFQDNRRGPATHSFPELLLRYGLTERVELRFGWNYETGGGGSTFSPDELSAPSAAGRMTHENNVLYGLKARLSEQEGWLPESSVLFQGFTPTGGEETATQLLTAYVVGWKLPNRWKLEGALHFAANSEVGDRFEVWAPSVVLRVPLGEHWHVHAEYFGLFSHDREEEFTRHFFSPGIHALITTNLEVGVRVGWGLNDQSARFFSNVGAAWRF
jgi:Putative MetA-pathway of phenol degradation